MNRSVEAMLSELGLSGLEADVYLAVYREPESTGYRISQILGKAAPNTYKALNALVVKGAVLLDEGDGTRTYTAVSVDELAAAMKKRISSIAAEISRNLDSLKGRGRETGLYTLNSLEQVFARAESMIDRASSTIVMDADVAPVMKLRQKLTEAASRGVRVLVHGRDPVEIPGCCYIPSVSEGWEGEMLLLVTDGSEYLVSFMSRGMKSLIKSVWSSNFIAACMHRSYTGKAMFYAALMKLNEPGMTLEELRAGIRDLWEKIGYGEQDHGSAASLLK